MPKLTDRQIEHMDLLLEQVLTSGADKTGTKRQIKELNVEFRGDLYQRERFTVANYERFVRWCEEIYDVRAPLDDSKSLGNSLFLINLAHSEISERDIFDRAVEEFKGKYLLFTWVGNERARITWIELKPQTEPSTIPSFEAYRDSMVFYGIYYAFEESLFLFGHKRISPMSRSIFLTKTEDSRPLDLVGIVSGASYDKKVFASSCYAHALENDVTRQSVERHIGDQTLEFVFRHYPHVKIVFDKYSRVQMDIPRQSDD